MFGMLPNLDEMMQQVIEFKMLFDRQVTAIEECNRKLDQIQKHLGITDVRDAEFTQITEEK